MRAPILCFGRAVEVSEEGSESIGLGGSKLYSISEAESESESISELKSESEDI
jgi:hypothetical protein